MPMRSDFGSTGGRPVPSGLLGIVLRCRFVLLVAALGAAIGALLMFWEGGLEIRDGLRQAFTHDSMSPAVVTFVMEATDKFLFGLVLTIFSFAITFGFAFDLPDEMRDRLPGWMRVEGASELKHVFFEVILLYLAVDFVTDVAETEAHKEWGALVMPIAILLLAGAMRLLAGGNHKTHPHG